MSSFHTVRISDLAKEGWAYRPAIIVIKISANQVMITRSCYPTQWAAQNKRYVGNRLAAVSTDVSEDVHLERYWALTYKFRSYRLGDKSRTYLVAFNDVLREFQRLNPLPIVKRIRLTDLEGLKYFIYKFRGRCYWGSGVNKFHFEVTPDVYRQLKTYISAKA